MTGESPLKSVAPIAQAQPLIFISHRYADRAIADCARKFFREKSGNSVAVYQFSAPEAEAPRIGQAIKPELASALLRTDVLLLIYTGNDLGWDYCMWECGVATHPDSPDTKVIVLQCGPDRPKVFEDQVNVNGRDEDMLLRFVNDFLTNPEFFPRRQRATTEFQVNGDSVRDAARQFFASLQAAIGPNYGGPTEEWQALPFVRLGWTAEQVGQVADQEDESQAGLITESLLQKASLEAYGGGAESLFGKLTLPLDAPFGQIFARPLPEGRRPPWLCALAEQVARAATWRYPPSRWSVMRSATETDASYYSPVLTHVRRLPGGAMQFDIHFHRFIPTPGSPVIEIALPEDTVP